MITALYSRLGKLVALPVLLGAALQAAPVQWTAAMGGNDNWYEYIPATSIFAPIDFNTARTAALARTHLGLSGYLATITSAGELSFIQNAGFPFLLGFGFTGVALLGATDEAEEGTFRWTDGPEAGQALSFTSWAPGHPSANDFLGLFTTAAGPPYTFVANGASAFGYLVEYGDAQVDAAQSGSVPEPGAISLMAAGVAVLAVIKRFR